MDAKKVGLYVIFGMAIAYLITAIGWSGAHMSQCNEEYEKNIAKIDFKVSDAKNEVQQKRFTPSQLNLFSASPSFIEKTIKKLEEDVQSTSDQEKQMQLRNDAIDAFGKKEKEIVEAQNKLCFSKGGSYHAAEYNWKKHAEQKFYDNTTFSSSDIVSNFGVSEIGYIVMYCVLFVAIGLGIFATIKDNKTIMIAFSATVGVSALILFIFNIVFMAQVIAPRNNYLKAIDDLSQKERLGFQFFQGNPVDWNQYERYVKPDDESVIKTNKAVSEFQEDKAKKIETAKEKAEAKEKEWEKEQETIDALADEKDKKLKQDDLDFQKKTEKRDHSEAYESAKKKWNATTKTRGFAMFSVAFAEFSFFVISSVAGFLLFKC